MSTRKLNGRFVFRGSAGGHNSPFFREKRKISRHPAKIVSDYEKRLRHCEGKIDVIYNSEGPSLRDEIAKRKGKFFRKGKKISRKIF